MCAVLSWVSFSEKTIPGNNLRGVSQHTVDKSIMFCGNRIKLYVEIIEVSLYGIYMHFVSFR